MRPKGGTGQAVEMARRKGIPTINMADANWREQLKAAIANKPSVQPITEPAAVEKTPQPGDVVSYNEKPYLLWNINAAGKAQLTDPDGTKFSGTPEMNKLSYVKTLPKVEFNNKMFVVDSKNRIFSLSSGNEVYKKAAERSKILDKLKSSTTQPSTTTDVEPSIVNKKQELLGKINKAVRETNLTELLAEKGYDVTDIISNLQAATTQEDINKINKILDKLC